jgi:leader peptidase (prepilin peptidase)/N-methyltransferase
MIATASAVGYVVGAVLNIGLSRRVPQPDPVCPRCGAPVSFVNNLPFVSWFRVTLRCTRCDWQETDSLDWFSWGREVLALHGLRGLRLTPSFFLVGLAFAALWGTSAGVWGGTPRAIQAATLGSFLLAIAISDARIMIIPAEYTLGGIATALLLGLFGKGIGLAQSILGCVAGALLIWSVGVVGTRLLKKEAMGGGDVDLMAMVGAFLGVKAVFLTVFLGALAGTLVYGPLLLVRRGWGQHLPFGVYLALGAAITFVAGDALIAAYLRLVLGS